MWHDKNVQKRNNHDPFPGNGLWEEGTAHHLIRGKSVAPNGLLIGATACACDFPRFRCLRCC